MKQGDRNDEIIARSDVEDREEGGDVVGSGSRQKRHTATEQASTGTQMGSETGLAK